MARVKRAVNAQKKRRTVLESASGYRGQRSRLYRKAKEQMLHSLQYAYRDRRDRKGDFRQLWITRINAAARANGMTYNRLIQGLRLAGVEVDRKILADLAVNDAAAFAALVEVARAAVAAEGTGGAAARPPDPHASRCGSPATRGGRPCHARGTPRVVAARRLQRRRDRDATGRFLAEGPQAVREALAGRRGRRAVRHRDRARPARRAGRRRAGRRAGRPRSTDDGAGRAGRDRRPAGPGRGLPARSTSPLAAGAGAARRGWSRCCAEIRDPGNAGTVLRTADAAGAGAVVFAGDAVDPYNGKCVRACAGSLFHVDVVRAADPRAAVDGAARRRADACWPPTGTATATWTTSPTPAGWPARPPGCSAPRRTACRPSWPAAPTPGSGCRSTGAPRA